MQEEISLREIIQTIWNGKWLIAIITAIAVVLSGLISFFVLPPTYEALSTVRVGNGSVDTERGYNLNALAETLKSDVAMKRVIDKLKLDNKQYSIKSIQNSIEVQVVKNTSVMKLTVNGSDSSVITNISNLLAFELGARIEISDRSQKIVEAKKKIFELNDLIAISNNAIVEANKQLEQNPEKLVTIKKLADDPYLQSIVKDNTSTNNKDISAFNLESEEINPVYSTLKETISVTAIDLARKIAEKQTLEDNIKNNETKIAELEQQILKEKLRTMSSERLLDGFNAVFISPAIEPSAPVGPNKILNVMISAVIGFILSLMIVFIRHYWRTSAAPHLQNQGSSLTG